MTRTIILNISTEPKALPAGKTFQGFKFTLTAPSGNGADQVTQETTVSFPDALPGTYSATVVAIDQGNEPLGTPVKVQVVVTDEGGGSEVYPSPVGLSYTLA